MVNSVVLGGSLIVCCFALVVFSCNVCLVADLGFRLVCLALLLQLPCGFG